MQTFLLPYIIAGQPAEKLFVKVDAANITLAAIKAEGEIRKAHTAELCANLKKELVAGEVTEFKPVRVAVAEIDYMYRDKATGKLDPTKVFAAYAEQARERAQQQAAQPQYKKPRKKRCDAGQRRGRRFYQPRHDMGGNYGP